MRRKNREINIFSISALDLFASAMGAFLLIAVMALPYYLKVDKDIIKKNKQLEKALKQVQSDLEQTKQKLAQCEDVRKKQEKQAQKMQKELSKTFCDINMSWESSKEQDIDMYVIDPDGRSYAYNNRRYSGSDAMFTVDSKGVTKGAEVWITSELQSGEYKIYYRYYSGKGPLNVNGRVFTKSFTTDLPVVSMRTPSSEKRLIAVIKVDDSGNAVLDVRQ